MYPIDNSYLSMPYRKYTFSYIGQGNLPFMFILNGIHSKGLNSIHSLPLYELTKSRRNKKVCKEARICFCERCNANYQIFKSDGFKLFTGDGIARDT